MSAKMAAFVRLFPQLHKKAAGIPVIIFLVAAADQVEIHTKREIVCPTFFDMSHPAR